MTNQPVPSSGCYPDGVTFDGLERPLSILDYQNIYHQITGRMEEIEKTYSDNTVIEFSDIQQIHLRICQVLDIHNVIGRTEVISIFHIKDRKEEFTSFERFTLYNANSVNPTIAVIMRYNFSILLPNISKPQNYKITIKLTSRIAIEYEVSEDEDMPEFIRSEIIGPTSQIKIEYADYVVARGFVDAYDEWIKCCKKNEHGYFIKFLKRNISFISFMLPLMMAFTIGVYAYKATSLLQADGVQFGDLARFGVLFFGSFSILTNIANFAGGVARRTITSFHYISYIKLNRGDDDLILKYEKNNLISIAKFVGNILMVILLGIASSKLSLLL